MCLYVIQWLSCSKIVSYYLFRSNKPKHFNAVFDSVSSSVYCGIVFDLSKSILGYRRRRGEGKECEKGVKISDFLNFKIVHSGAFLCTNSKVSFAIMTYLQSDTSSHGILAIDGNADTKTSSFHQSRKPISI